MLPLSFIEIVQATQGILVMGDPRSTVGASQSKAETKESNLVAGISTDSRTLHRGDIFFALRGERYDGHNFLNEAIRKGAALCVVSKIPSNLTISPADTPAIVQVKECKKALADCAKYYRQKYGSKTQIVGISGSCGKTTVKEMLIQILNRYAPTVYSAGNFNNEIGCPRSIFSLHTNHCFGVFELGASSLGEVKRLAEIVSPQAAIVTNIRLEHTETFGSLENIAEGESEILPLISEDGFAILPFDDPFYDFLKSKLPRDHRVKIKSFGFSKAASVSAVDIAPGSAAHPFSPALSFSTADEARAAFRTNFRLLHRDNDGKILDQFSCALPVLGRFNVLNACAAAAAAFCLKVPREVIQDGLENFVPPRMRFQISPLKNNAIVVNDSYNANPGSMRASLEGFIESFPDRERCVVLGDMLELGEISQSEHYALGKFLARLPLSKVVLFGHQSKFVADGARDAFLGEENLFYCLTGDSLWKRVHSLTQPNTAILFKASRGMHLEEVVQKLIAESS